MVRVLASGSRSIEWIGLIGSDRSSGPGSGPGRGDCVVFLGKTVYSHGAPLHPGV